ncbi:L,D-transpeptidase family protein [Pseudodesulfovibrio sp.]|uniref:L,D-transpeptidase family protein n=1 Tax=unclassified Pseudodesulfovibrio TaxID=2661612 RepID=UPI003AFFD2A3
MPSRKQLSVLVLIPLLITATLVFSATAATAAEPSWMESCRQLVLVTAPDWDSQTGTLRWYERRPDSPWKKAGGPVPVTLGVHGLGWGIGLHSDDTGQSGEPVKMEGDGKAPAGAFGLPMAFAYEPNDLAGTNMPVMGVGPDLYCVDDTASPYYNSLLRMPGNAKPWKSAETMLRPDGVYRIGLLVPHNMKQPVPGRGSCIFMHLLKKDNAPTSGCTAMDWDTLKEIILWLTPQARPVLVQLPDAAYGRLQGRWNLP